MLQSLDPHSLYLNKKDFKELTSDTKGEFGGLGLFFLNIEKIGSLSKSKFL